MTTLRVKHYLRTRAKFNDVEWREWQTHWFDNGLQALEKMLVSVPSSGRFCYGDHPTIADICLASIIVVQRVYHLKTPDIPTVDRVMAACESVEEFRSAIPTLQEVSLGI